MNVNGGGAGGGRGTLMFRLDRHLIGALLVLLSDAPHKNYRKLHCSAALALSHVGYL